MWQNTFRSAFAGKTMLGERERTSFDLVTASKFTHGSIDARYAMLFAALEYLLKDVPCPAPVVNHVDSLIEVTSSSNLESFEKDSIVNSLRFVKQRSIRRSGRELVKSKLAGRRYDEIGADEFFLICYDLRNRIVHGGQPFPGREEVSRLVGGLEQMVSDLIVCNCDSPENY